MITKSIALVCSLLHGIGSTGVDVVKQVPSAVQTVYEHPYVSALAGFGGIYLASKAWQIASVKNVALVGGVACAAWYLMQRQQEASQTVTRQIKQIKANTDETNNRLSKLEEEVSNLKDSQAMAHEKLNVIEKTVLVIYNFVFRNKKTTEIVTLKPIKE